MMADRVSAAREYARIIEDTWFTGQRVNHVPTHVVMARMHINALLGEIDELAKIKQLARRFVEQYDAAYCWIENGGEEVSIALDELTESFHKVPKEEKE